MLRPLSRFAFVLFLIVLVQYNQAMAQDTTSRTTSVEGASVYIITPLNGASVEGPVTVRFGLKGMGVAPANTRVEATGHHHLMIDVAELPSLDYPLPSDDQHLHFGGGQTEVTLDLSPGTHTLQLIFGDYAHTPHDPPLVSRKITFTLK